MNLFLIVFSFLFSIHSLSWAVQTKNCPTRFDFQIWGFESTHLPPLSNYPYEDNAQIQEARHFLPHLPKQQALFYLERKSSGQCHYESSQKWLRAVLKTKNGQDVLQVVFYAFASYLNSETFELTAYINLSYYDNSTLLPQLELFPIYVDYTESNNGESVAGMLAQVGRAKFVSIEAY